MIWTGIERWKLRLMAALAAAMLAVPAGALADTASSGGWAAVAARVLPATVSITVTKIAVGTIDQATGDATVPGSRSHYVGSGFIVDPSGIIVTNKHVVGGALWISVRLQNGTVKPATVLAVSPLVDLALLKITVNHPLPTLRLGDGDAVQPGEPVLAVGDPLGVGVSVSAGVVSAARRDIMLTPFDDYVQTDAAINHGNSGGPLLDSAGHVIGVNTILLTNQPNQGSQGVNLAISSSLVADALRHLLHPGQYPIGWIGLHFQAVSENLALAMGLPPRPGTAIVTSIDPGSPALAAGVQPGDIVLRFGHETFPGPWILMRDIATTPIGATRDLEIWRSGSLRKIPVTVRAWPHQSDAPATMLENPASLGPPPPDLGLLLTPITPLARQAYALGDDSGVLVAAVDPMSEAFGRNLRPGVVIEEIGNQRVTTPAAAQQDLAEATHRQPLIALLVRWPNGLRWVTLHTGYRTGLATNSTSGDGATIHHAAASGMADADKRRSRSDASAAAPAKHAAHPSSYHVKAAP